jgi:hypothetical protein
VASLMQSAACHAVHSVEQRCARWLLSTGDRVGYGSGRVTICDRGALKDAACECYGIVKRQLTR